jgi:hypothetical protein
MIMKTLIATAIVALGLLSTTITAQAASFDGYPEWAQRAFEEGTYGG